MIRNNPVHDHPCGYCSKLGECSCSYPALREGFVCEVCRPGQQSIALSPEDKATLESALYVLDHDQTYRSLADRMRALVDRVVTT